MRRTGVFKKLVPTSVLAAAVVFTGVMPQPLAAQTRPVLLRDSFPIGDAEGVLCSVQDRSAGSTAAMTVFDRHWAVVCRDSAQPVAEVFAFKNVPDDPFEKVAQARRFVLDCFGSKDAGYANVSDAVRYDCKTSDSKLNWSTVSVERGEWTYVADGFTAYDDAMRLALQSVLDNRIAQGKIDAATTSVGDPLAFSRVQAESLKPEQALIEGYRRNLGGEYAEAAAYFETLQYRLEREGDSSIHPSEFVLNRALQKSNLGDFAEAEGLFDQARTMSAGNVVGERLQRNFEAIHLLNRGRPEQVAERLSLPLSAGVDGIAVREGAIEISVLIADRMNSAGRGSLVGFANETKLTLRERAEIIDAQALQIAGTAQRLLGDRVAARASLGQAEERAMAVRDGRVTTIIRMRSQIMGDLARIEELDGNLGRAEGLLRGALTLIETQYPERRAVGGAEARLAAFLLRNGQESEALAIYEALVDRTLARNSGATGITNQMTPYYRYLAGRSATDAAASSRFFKAAQLLVRPGIAETQAVFARELSGGSDEASRLFRQSTDLSREIEQKRIRYLQLVRTAEGSTDALRLAAELEQEIERLEQAQLSTQAQLADFPQYRMVANRAIELGEFQALMEPGEAYARLAQSGTDLFMVYASRDEAKVWKVPLSQEDLDFHVDVIRASIALEENGQLLTYPFDVEMARELFAALFGPVADRLGGIDHLIFEPDGAMLRLPIDLLVTDNASLETYNTQAAQDEYDFRGVAWLGRDRRISTAVSAQGFVDARQAPSSSAAQQYLGLGENVPVGEVTQASVRGGTVTGNDNCLWNLTNWNRPIDDRELQVASSIIGGARSQVQTGADFTDSNIKARADLDEFRILHFATHGLVTPPRPDCAAQPALLTSFGAEGSDGLLSFDEIFDLNLDADLVILSACDTAAGATIEATRAAGLTSGGGTSLDGLVRAFVGAGGRTVLASHWPAPDDFDATGRLMSAMFREGQTASVGAALKTSQRALMDDAATSHPYYWAGFALVGDGNRALLSGAPSSSSAAAE
ncbi:CHAT domain-containing protein [Erythrobacter sp. W53]|uniref:CHAT domain-containing protein n=1 Tax=Erythrobacter sp. W53 TaxID=3425947 RepID=UPI003D76929E